MMGIPFVVFGIERNCKEKPRSHHYSFVVKRSLNTELIMLKHKYCRTSITPEPLPRFGYASPGHSFKGSTSSLASSNEGTIMRRKKKKAPAPPVPKVALESHDGTAETVMVNFSIYFLTSKPN